MIGELFLRRKDFEIFVKNLNRRLSSLTITRPSDVGEDMRNFIDADDTPAAFAGGAGKVLRVNGAEDAIEFCAPGIADDDIVEIDAADVVALDYAKFTANGLQGRSYDEVLADLSGQALAAFSWNNQNLTNLGTGHDAFSDFVANEHIDWTNAAVNLLTTGTGAFSKVIIDGALAEFRLVENDRPADHQMWRFLASAEIFQIFAAKDDLSAVVAAGGIFLNRSANFGFGTVSWGANAVKVLSMGTGTAPTTSPADVYQMYSADIQAGEAAPHFRTEHGDIIKLYQQPHIIDADGNLADITTKFNTLLSYLENTGLLANV